MYMPTIADNLVLDRVEHILASGTGVLDFGVVGEDQYYSWWGTEDADWTVKNIGSIQNTEDDRIVFYPANDYFTCEIAADSEEDNRGPVRCR
jgi:hypothetical protein